MMQVPDAAKVIKAMECCLHMLTDSGESHCKECPYNDLIMNHECKNPVYCIRDYVRDALVILKSNEPVEPELNDDSLYVSDKFKCGACGGFIEFHARYCKRCGRPVRWFTKSFSVEPGAEL